MNESSADDLPRMQTKRGAPGSPSTAHPMMSEEQSQMNSRNMDNNPLLDDPNTPYSMNNLLNESDSTMLHDLSAD